MNIGVGNRYKFSTDVAGIQYWSYGSGTGRPRALATLRHILLRGRSEGRLKTITVPEGSISKGSIFKGTAISYRLVES